VLYLIHINEAVIVEGKYDKIRLSNFIDALIICTDGFSVFKDKEKQKFIKRLARERGLLIITDSDSAGFKIRAFLAKIVPENTIKHAYIPDIYGKEKRKEEFSKEGKMGVEGVDDKIIIDALTRAGVVGEKSDNIKNNREITTADLVLLGLSGCENSAEKRRAVLRELDLPERLSTSSFIRILNTFVTIDELNKAVEKI